MLGRQITVLAIVFGVFVLTATPSNSDDMQALYPGHSSSTKYFVDFKARSGFPGHAFVYIGRELDNGLSVVEAVAGFYPSEDGKSRAALKNIAHGPGIVTAKLTDLASTVSFRVYRTSNEITEILSKIEGFNDQDYALLENNCLDLVNQVATLVGIRTGDTSIFPYAALLELQRRNDIRLLIEGNIAGKQQDIVEIGGLIDTSQTAAIEARRQELELFEQHLATQEALNLADQNNQQEIARLTQELNRIAQLQIEAQERIAANLRETERLRRERESITIEFDEMIIEADRWHQNREFDKVRLGLP